MEKTVKKQKEWATSFGSSKDVQFVYLCDRNADVNEQNESASRINGLGKDEMFKRNTVIIIISDIAWA